MNRLKTNNISALLLLVGFGLLLTAVLDPIPFGATPMPAGDIILREAAHEIGTANLVTAVVLAYRGFDTLGELTILFVAATAAVWFWGRGGKGRAFRPGGFVLRAGADLLFPFLLVVGAYIITHGHLTPGGGFQGGAVLAAAFFVPLLADPASRFKSRAAAWIEGGAGVLFILIGLAAWANGKAFLTPLLGPGVVGEVFSAGTVPLLYGAVGVKVGAELAGLLAALLAEPGDRS